MSKPPITSPEIQANSRKQKRSVLWVVVTAVVAGVLGIGSLLWVRENYIKVVRVPSGGMLPTLQIGDMAAVDLRHYRGNEPKVGEVVYLVPPVRAIMDPSQIGPDGKPNVQFLGRCVGVPGDVVEIRGGNLFRNGKEVMEAYVSEKSEFDFKLVQHKGQFMPCKFSADWVNAEMLGVAPEYVVEDVLEMEKLRGLSAQAVPPGFILTMGDNRNGAYDGRGWGLLPRKNLLGRVMLDAGK